MEQEFNQWGDEEDEDKDDEDEEEEEETGVMGFSSPLTSASAPADSAANHFPPSPASAKNRIVKKFSDISKTTSKGLLVRNNCIMLGSPKSSWTSPEPWVGVGWSV